MMWRNVWAVIRREYLQRVRSKRFVISTVAVPTMMILMIAVPAAIASRNDDEARTVAVVDRTGVLLEGLEPDLTELGWTVEAEPGSPGIEVELRRRAEDGEILGFIVLDDATLSEGIATFETTSRPNPVRTLTLRGAITRAAMERRLEESGSADAILSGGELRIEMLASDGGSERSEEGPEYVVAFFGAFILYMVTLIYAVTVMRATLEEKTSRIVEVIVSSMEPWHLLLGKILGVGAVSLTQLGIWLGTGALAAGAGIPTLMTARPDLTGLIDLQAALPGLGKLALFVALFLFGFFMFSGLYAAVGAMCNTEEDANQAQFPVAIFLIGAMMLTMPVIYDPSAPWAVAASLFPLFSPMLMWARISVSAVPMWQIVAAFGLLAVGIVAVAWIAGRIYRVGILMTGKRPTLPELWRWVRA